MTILNKLKHDKFNKCSTINFGTSYDFEIYNVNPDILTSQWSMNAGKWDKKQQEKTAASDNYPTIVSENKTKTFNSN